MRNSFSFRGIKRRIFYSSQWGSSPVGIILMYHRVNDAVQDPWELCVSPANFEEHLEVLRKYSCVPLEKMEDGKRKDGHVALTFDDGYADNLHVAIPMLEHFDMPAAFFITTGGLGSDREFWWDELEQLILGEGAPPEIAFAAGDLVYSWNTKTGESIGPVHDPQSWWPAGDSAALRVYRSCHHVLQLMEDADRAAAMQAMAKDSACVLGGRESHRRLNWDELVQLSRHKLAEIGAHTVTHPKLSACNRARQEFEIRQSKADLEERIGRPVASFAYPYGSAAHINQTSVDLVQQAGFLRACTSRKALVREVGSCFAWPRIHVPNLDGNEFEELLTATFSQC
jgi:peptidoglycan/xylan/chitin deacetylase (PgdA/CDA1 family)